ncbi:MAG: hypothetical protein KDD64_07445 [Bdellovibrionales bacterium]|nr:hypothetical protein [Bdellovibrionales bacterium]
MRKRDIFSLMLALIVSNGALAEDPAPNVDPVEEPVEVLDLSAPVSRQRPGEDAPHFPAYVYESVPDINSSASDFVPVPDRWRQFYAGKWYDPYNQNVLKGDVPVFGSPGHEWFLETGVISETLLERLKIPVPVGVPSTNNSGTIDTFGNGNISVFVQQIIPTISLIRGNTVFMPPEIEFRFTPVFSFTNVEASETGIVRVDPARGTDRSEGDLSFLEAFADIHLANISERYDFISSRIGVQKFSSDFRGFIYNDQQPGVRLFGNWDNNMYQYNFAWFPRLEKQTNTFVNEFETRHEDVFVWNVYRQDLIVPGHQVQASIIYRDDQAGSHGDHYNDNGLLVRPAAIGDERAKNIRSTYFGLNGDGHIGRVNTTTAFYYVTGTETHNQIAGREQDISAFMFAQELSYDFDWLRLRGSLFWSSGDSDPDDGTAEGFDAIFDLPNFAGGDLSYWQRQNIPLIGGGEVFLVNLGSLIPNLRPGKEEGQSNFVNPGIRLYNLGVDVELTQEMKVISNASYLQFDDTATLEKVRQLGGIDREIGWDLSVGVLYRPFLNNNVQFRLGASSLVPGDGLETLYGDKTLYSVFSNMILEY